MTPSTLQRLAAAAGAIVVWGSSAHAQQTSTFVDLSGGVGYSTEPFLRVDGEGGNFFARASAYGVHAWRGERSETNLSAFVETPYYFGGDGFRPIFALDASTARQVSERVQLFGSASFSGDIAGQLTNRFVYVPPAPEVPDPAAPPPITVEDPDLFAFTGRHYLVGGQVGAAIAATERSSVSVSGGAQRVFVSGNSLGDYTTIFGSGSYNRLLSERTTVGGTLNVRRSDYEDTGDGATIVNPAAIIRTRLSEQWDASASVGVIFAQSDVDGDSDNSVSLSFSGSMCRSSETERLCGNVARDAYSAARASLLRTTSASVNWFKMLDQDQTVQLSASVARFTGEATTQEEFKSQHYRLAASYSRRLSDRLSVGSDVGVRKLTRIGPDPRTDLTGAVFLRYRIGDLS